MSRAALPLALAFLLAGCAGSGAPTSPPTTGTTTQEPEPSTLTLFLQFPMRCYVAPVGNTSYTVPPLRACTYNDPGYLVENRPCGQFVIHDPKIQLHEGDKLHGIVDIRAGGATDAGALMVDRLVWRDANGTVAESRKEYPPFIQNPNTVMEGQATATRDSDGPLWLDVFRDNGRCSGVNVGTYADPKDYSRFTIERAS